MSAPVEFDCAECGRHIVRLDGVRPDPLLCLECLNVPGWFSDPRLVAILDPDYRPKKEPP